MEFIDNVLCLPACWLYEPYKTNGGDNLPPIMTYEAYKHKVIRKQIATVGHPGPNKPAMVAYDKLNDNIKQLIQARVGGNPYTVYKRNLIERIIQPDSTAARFFTEYILPNGCFLSKEKMIEYTNNVRIFNVFTEILNNRKSVKYKMVGSTAKQIWEYLSDSLKLLNLSEYSHSLPTYPRRLQEKYNEYIAEGYEVIIHKGFGNQNTAKVNAEDKEAVLNNLLSHHNNLDNEQVARLYNYVAQPLGWAVITAATVAYRRKQTATLTAGGRRGLTDFRNKITMQMKRSAPECALYYWTLDGWDAELLYQKTKTDKDGYSVTTYHNRLTIVTVLDVCCKYPIGYAVGTHETPELIKAALRNAVDHVNELFEHRYKPLQIQSDHYGKGSLTGLYEAVTEKYTPARVKNAKAKVVEPYFGYINKTYCQLMDNWSGFGITSKKEHQPNEEHKNAIKKSFPDEAGCRKQIEQIITMERQKKNAAFLTAFEKLPDNDKHELSLETYLYWFGETTGYKNALEPSGLHVTILGEKRTYDCFDINFRMCVNSQWNILYNPNDLQKVLAVNNDGSKRFLLEDKYIQPMALADRKEGDSTQMKRVNDFNKGLETKVLDFNKHNYEKTAKVLEDPRVSDTLTKMLLTDSRGQHKNNRNELRNEGLKELKKAEQKQEKQLAKQEQKSYNQEREEYIKGKINVNDF